MTTGFSRKCPDTQPNLLKLIATVFFATSKEQKSKLINQVIVNYPKQYL